MTSMMFQNNAAASARGFTARSARMLPRRMQLRLRRKIPSWAGLLLLALIGNVALAALAWGAVYLVLN